MDFFDSICEQQDISMHPLLHPIGGVRNTPDPNEWLINTLAKIEVASVSAVLESERT